MGLATSSYHPRGGAKADGSSSAHYALRGSSSVLRQVILAGRGESIAIGVVETVIARLEQLPRGRRLSGSPVEIHGLIATLPSVNIEGGGESHIEDVLALARAGFTRKHDR